MAYPHQPGSRSPSRRAGMTLIELLLAIGIAVLLVTLLYSIYHTVTRTAEGQDGRHRAARPVAATIDTFIQDLGSMVLPDEDETCLLILQPGETLGHQFDELASCSAVPSPDERDGRWAVFQRVRHRVVQDESGYALMRESSPLTGPGSYASAVTNILLTGMAKFKVEIYDGTTWHPAWPPEGDHGEPAAARIAFMREGDEEPTRIELVIAAGFPVIQRETQGTQASPRHTGD